MHRRATTMTTTVLLATVPLVGGCAASIPLAAVGTALGIGATAVSTGASVYSLGKLNSAEPQTADGVRHACERVADELGFRTLDAGYQKENYVFHWTDDGGQKVEVIVEPRAARLTRLRVDVGVFGNEPTARLILERVRARLGTTPAPVDPATKP